MKKKGITLVELVVSMAILVMCILLVNNIFLNSKKTLDRVDKKAYLQDVARKVLDDIGNDIKSASTAIVPVMEPGNVINVNGDTYTVNNLSRGILYFTKEDGSKYLYGEFVESGEDTIKKINLNDAAYCKVYSDCIKTLEVTQKSEIGNGTNSKELLSTIYSIRITVAYKGESKAYDTATFIIKGGKEVR